MALAYDYKDAHSPLAAPPKRAVEPTSALVRMGLTMTFAKDEEIYGQDEDADLIYRLLEGAVRTTRFMADGRRQIGDFYLAGDIFGLETGPRHRFAAEAVRDSAVLSSRPRPCARRAATSSGWAGKPPGGSWSGPRSMSCFLAARPPASGSPAS